MRYVTDRCGRVYVDRGLGFVASNGTGAVMRTANYRPITELTELPAPQPPTSASCCLSNTGLCYCTISNRSVLSPGACGPNTARCDGQQPGTLAADNVSFSECLPSEETSVQLSPYYGRVKCFTGPCLTDPYDDYSKEALVTSCCKSEPVWTGIGWTNERKCRYLKTEIRPRSSF